MKLTPRPLLLLALLWACAPEAQTPTGDSANNNSGQDAGILVPDVLPDLPTEDVSPDAPDETDVGPPAFGEYGAPCDSDEGCREGFCLPDGPRGVCSRYCLDGCEPFWPDRPSYCRADPSRGEVAFLCYPLQDRLCEPCLNDSQCDGAPCAPSSDGLRCGRLCDDALPCPDGFSCLPFGDGQASTCVPDNGSCSCRASNAGDTRTCLSSNELGACPGQETCDPALGWTGCDAPTPQAETCDGLDQDCDGVPDDGLSAASCAIENELGACPGVSFCQGPGGELCVGPSPQAETCDLTDNDCDGLIDEGFTDPDTGLYTTQEHCGGCNQACPDRFAFASQTACEPRDGLPTCVITACEPGYQKLGDTLCVPLQDVTCQACQDDADCALFSVGAACVTLGDPDDPETLAQACGRDCSPDSPFGESCPEGMACLPFRDGALHQCVPAGGSCLCRDNEDGFAVPCELPSPNDPARSCQGLRRCQGDQLGPCQAPDEVCDGLDNDCDGLVDEGARDPATGRYDLDPAHCGRCLRDCAALTFPNASATCDAGLDTPACVMTCDPGAFDLANGPQDGCECVFVSDQDRPDGADQNCDGLDGTRAAAVFVSKLGRPDADGTLEDPLDTLQAGLDLANASQGERPEVYVATGVYGENVLVPEGVRVYGGFSLDFLRYDPDLHQTTLLGQPSEFGAALRVVGALDLETLVQGFTIYGPNASSPSQNSYAVHLQDCDDALTLRDNHIRAGHGGDGLRGQAGDSGDDAPDGADGRNAVTASNHLCSLPERAGGAGALHTCEDTPTHGGAGGAARCPQSQQINGAIPCSAANSPEFGDPDPNNDCRNTCIQSPCPPLPPPQGVGAAGLGPNPGDGGAPTYDRWNDLGYCEICGLQQGLPHRGDPGQDGGDGPLGQAGAGCADPRGLVNAQGQWTALPGSDGGDGDHGSGGGGGSAGSGFDIGPAYIDTGYVCRDTVGGSGGGGGAGGCRGTRGSGGTSGGGSFAVMLHYTRPGFSSLPALTNNTLTLGFGGDGGPGGPGGVGGLGGLGGDGGIAVVSQALCADPGGRGGNGGDGGAGGGGGGGCGGPSAGVYLHRNGNDRLDASTLRRSNTFFLSGQGGRGGDGGGSTGLPGLPGDEGISGDILQR